MDNKLENLLNKINLAPFYMEEFKEAKIEKIRVGGRGTYYCTKCQK